MSRFFGPVGFVTSMEVPEGSGIWIDVATEKNYRGEVSRNTKRWDNTQTLNDNINISNVVSIVADPYISNKLFAIKYVKWLGSYWEVTSAEVQYPRIVLSLGGVYNGPKAGTSPNSEEHPRIS